MADDPRRFDDLVTTVRGLRAQLVALRGTVLNRVATHSHVGDYATGGRPSALSSGAGAQIYDTTLSKPVWSDGTVWRDVDGTYTAGDGGYGTSGYGTGPYGL